MLFGLVKREGMANTRVVLGGDTPDAGAPAMARPPRIDERPTYEQRPLYGDARSIASSRATTSGRVRRTAALWRAATLWRTAPHWRAARADDRVRVYRAEPPLGYWVQYPDGRRVYVDRERDRRPATDAAATGAACPTAGIERRYTPSEME